MKLGEVEEYLSSLEEPSDCGVVEEDEYNMLMADLMYIYIPSLSLYVRLGLMSTKDEDGEWSPDVSLTFVYDQVEDIKRYLYYESDGVLCTLHNFLVAQGKAADLYELECEIVYHERLE